LVFLIGNVDARHGARGERFTIWGTIVPDRDRSLTLAPGTHFGRYEIVCPLGAGGMGEVYRARDTNLGRELAIKILSSKISASQHALERFEREARSVSRLNHPNIVTIFELARVDVTYYMAMELVEGELLSDMLRAGALPLRKAISIAAQMASGLAKAHEAGIVHRDLKPGNVMITSDGLVKILDFGLAKLMNPDSDPGGDGETQNASLTRPGAIVGTLTYMSPEQASGIPVDFRSDQFSFGSTLYEMVAGKNPFQRPSEGGTMVAIVRDDPESVLALNPRTPAPLCWVIERCLAKNPRERYASTHDLARDLATIHDRLDEAPSRLSPAQSHNLPLQRTEFIGRHREVTAVKELLLRSEVRAITLTGPGGIGKTRLALKAAGEVAQNFPGGVCFVPLAAVKDPALVPAVIAQALGMKETGIQVTMESLKEYLPDVRTNLLMLFDTFEHLLAAASAVAELLAAAPTLKLLATSRAPLHIYGEHEFPVPPLPLPNQRASAKALSQNPSVALFVNRAVAVKPNFELTGENAPAVAAICARLEGLPLAIELAAARIKLLSPAAMQARLEKRLELLTGGARDLPERQQTLRGTIDWSYGLLNATEQALFRRVSAFAGGCTLEGVEAVCNTRQDLAVDVLEGMSSLVDKSLVQQVESSGSEARFVLLDTVREYGLECLASSGEEQETKRVHAAYCLVVAEECASRAANPADAEWAEALEAEHENCRAALEWLTQEGNADWGLRLAAALFQFWEMREYHSEGRHALKRLLALEGAAERSVRRARALFSAGVLGDVQGDCAAARAMFEESLAIAREQHDARGTGIALNALAAVVLNRGDLEESRRLFEESLAVWGSLGDRVVLARSVSNLANVVKLQGDYAKASSLFEECLAIFRELGDPIGIAWSLNYRGDISRAQGQPELARARYGESLAAFQEVGDKWGIAGCLADLGSLARDQGDYETSQAHYAESMKLFLELGQKRGVARLLDCVACSAVLQSQPERALRLAGAAASMRRALGTSPNLAEQASLEKALEKARKSVPQAVAAAAWMDGWTTPPDKAIQDALEFG